MPKGPFASSVGVGRAEPEWAAKNLVTDICGTDELFNKGETSEAPLDPGPDVMSRDLSTCPEEVDLLIVGAGLSGCVIAERCSKEFGMSSLILEKRSHIGGNCYDYITETGLRASKYGAHLFHTKYDRVWEYVQQFSEWVPFDHRVKGRVPDKHGVPQLVPIPPTQETVSTLFGENIQSEEDMIKYYEKVRVTPPNGEPANGEEAALSRVGPDLYEKIFKHYTKKQWGKINQEDADLSFNFSPFSLAVSFLALSLDKYPEELDASVLMRLPCRTSTDDRYFGDQYQALPLRGYTRIFENMILGDDNITIRLNCDFFKHKANGTLPKHKLLVYTGQIDSYYASLGLPKLEYRSLHFEEEFVPEPEDGFFQEAMVVNYPSPDVKFTRIVEYKHVPNQPTAVKEGKVKGTLLARECSSAEGEPYYPVPNPENRALYEKYAEMAAKEEGVAFVGRLASYKYFNMDQAILNALEMYDNLKETGTLEPKRAPHEFGPGDGPK